MILQLFVTFFRVGIFTIGGGMVMIPLLQDIVVNKKCWLTEDEAIDCIAVSQGLPGVIAINMATYIGFKKRGVLGALSATLGVVLPSLIIIIIVAEFLRNAGDNSYVEGALVGIKAAATGLIAYSALKVGKKVMTGKFQWAIGLICFLIIVFLKISAVWAIVVGMLAGLAYELYIEKTKESERGEKK